MYTKEPERGKIVRSGEREREKNSCGIVLQKF